MKTIKLIFALCYGLIMFWAYIVLACFQGKQWSSDEDADF